MASTLARFSGWLRRSYRAWNSLEDRVRSEIGRIYLDRVVVVGALAATVTGLLTAFDLARRFATDPQVSLFPTDVSSIAFAVAGATFAVFARLRRGRLANRSSGADGIVVATLFVLAAFAHGVSLIFVGTSIDRSEIYLIVILLAAAGGVPLPPRIATATLAVAGAAAIGLLPDSPLPPGDVPLHAAVLAMVTVIAIAISMSNFHNWVRTQESRLRAEAVTRERERFLSIMAHDLRNPIGNIRQLVELLQNELRSTQDEDVTLFLTHLHTSAESTQSLLDNLLLWARARGGTLNVKSSQFSLNDVVETVLTGLTSQAEAKDVTLEVSATAEDHVCGDVHLTQTILRNLVANAIKFTPSGGKVSIAARTDVTSGRFELEVVDTGIGMDEKRLAAVLDTERASTRPGTAGEAGSGLGLTLVRELTARLGGDLRAQSEVDRGTRITVSLPSGSELT